MKTSLAELTTLGVGGPAGHYVRVGTEADLRCAIESAPEELLILGGGSNVLVSDDGFPGTVLHLDTRGFKLVSDEGGTVVVRAQAGHPWDDFVAACVEQGFSGLEALSGIPGRVGATPIQNVGAYGVQVGDAITGVWVRERAAAWSARALRGAELGFGYRTSTLKGQLMSGRVSFLVSSVEYQLQRSELSAPIGYPELARSLGVALGGRAPAGQVREHVLALRGSKGMVCNPEDRDTFSAGSFFLNPVVCAQVAARLPAHAPRYPADGGMVKLSAAWLIERAGFGRGFGGELTGGRASLSTKHTLAITNRGGGTAEDILTIARRVRQGVKDTFAVLLEPEPVLVHCTM